MISIAQSQSTQVSCPKEIKTSSTPKKGEQNLTDGGELTTARRQELKKRWQLKRINTLWTPGLDTHLIFWNENIHKTWQKIFTSLIFANGNLPASTRKLPRNN